MRGVALAVVLTAVLAAQTPPASPSSEWPAYGGDLASSRYSPLAQITAANFARCAWRGVRPRPTGS